MSSSTAAHCCLLLRTAICAPTRFIHSYINMLNWLKSGKLSSGTSYDNVVSHEGGEGPRESEDLEATDGENKKMSGSQTMRRRKPKRREGDGKKEIMRVNTRQGKKEGNMMTIIWVWVSLGSAIQII